MICSPSCSSMYSRIISSVIVPELTARYPLARAQAALVVPIGCEIIPESFSVAPPVGGKERSDPK
jgi:hypothetical protein